MRADRTCTYNCCIYDLKTSHKTYSRSSTRTIPRPTRQLIFLGLLILYRWFSVSDECISLNTVETKDGRVVYNEFRRMLVDASNEFPKHGNQEKTVSELVQDRLFLMVSVCPVYSKVLRDSISEFDR